MSGVTLDR